MSRSALVTDVAPFPHTWYVPGLPSDLTTTLSSIPTQLSANIADRAQVKWIDGLRASGAKHEKTVAELRALLMRAARFECQRRSASLPVRGPELDDISDQAANDALVTIIAKLDDFRGESQFTTWAYKFVVFEVSKKIGRHFWRSGGAVVDDVDWEHVADRLSTVPQQRVEQRELFNALVRAVEQDLTDHQRKVFVAVAIAEVPVDTLAIELGSNRNAIYKTLFDARRKLRSSLASAGYTLQATPEPR
jgi:RNA polymerase sigma-70 factor, ECF subfamily